MIQPLIIANWKMHKTHLEARAWLQQFREAGTSSSAHVRVLVASPFTALESLATALKEQPLPFPLYLAAQNLYPGPQGAFTGEISAPMLRALGVEYVILGHSERRQLFYESNISIGQKLKAALLHQLRPILCIGESADIKAQGQTLDFLKSQLEGSLNGIEGLFEGDASRLSIAYEPIWAIGSGIAASPEEIQAIHEGLRHYLLERFGPNAGQIPLLYGGSLKASNATAILGQKEVNGALVGGASLDAREFASMVAACGEIKLIS